MPTKTYTRKRIRKNAEGLTETRLTEQEQATAPTAEESAQSIVKQALARFRLAEEAERHNRTEGLYDLRFSTGDQWPADIKSERGRDGRPCLEVNRINQFLRQVANDEAESRPAAQVNPVGDNGDPEVAAILQGMFRHIEEDSRYPQIISRKFDAMLRKGWSWHRVLTEFESDDSHDQKIVFRDIPNDFTVYTDPTAVLPDRSDMNWALVVEDIPNGEYKSLYGNLPNGGMQLSSLGDQPASWISGKSVRVAEYYYFTETEEKLYKLRNGKGKFESDLNGTEQFELDDETGEVVWRMSKRRQLKWCKINCETILEGNADKSAGIDVPSPWIPLVFMPGEELDIDGERRLIGMVRYARDPQRMYNYWVSAQTEAIALAPKAPFLIAAGQIEGFENYWETANKRNWPYLPYKFVTSSGQPAPAPQRANASIDTSALSMAVRQADQDLMATMGIFRAGLGDVGPEKSGRAILARQKESDTANANYGQNRNWALLHAYRIALAMMPKIYDGERAIRIIRPNDESQIVLINQLFPGPGGNEIQYDIANSEGKYAVTLSIGAPASRRQQAVMVMSEILKAEPQLFTMIGDLFVSQMDADGDWKNQMVERLRKMLPPQLQDNDGQIPPQVQQLIQQLMQQQQLLTQALNEAQDQLESNEMDNEYKLMIAKLQAQKDMIIASMKFDSVESMEALRQEFSRISANLDRAHEKRMQNDEQAHEKVLARMKPKPKPNGSSKSA